MFIPVEAKSGRLTPVGPQWSPSTQHTAVPALELERSPVVGQVAPATVVFVQGRESESAEWDALRGEISPTPRMDLLTA